MKRPFLFANFAVLVCTLFFASMLQSQTGTSAISGIVSDQQGKGVPSAKVTITNIATNATRSVESTNTGAYIFDLIAPGDYRLEVEAKGFSKTIIDNVRALIGKQTETNAQMSVGAISQVVEVRASLQDSVINTQDASLGNVFDSTQISQLPLEGRNVSDLLSLQPGTTQEGYVTGSRADQSNVTLDGVDINNAQTGNASIAASDNSQVIGQFGGSSGQFKFHHAAVVRHKDDPHPRFRVLLDEAYEIKGQAGLTVARTLKFACELCAGITL